MDHVRVDRRDRVALITLIDRERRNAMTAAMVAEILDTFDALEADESVGAVVITGEPPAFCSGARSWISMSMSVSFVGQACGLARAHARHELGSGLAVSADRQRR